MANTRGLSTTTTQLAADLVVDMADKVLLLEPDKNRLIQFTTTLGKQVTHNTRFDWETDQMVQFSDTLNDAAFAAGVAVTDMTVTNVDRWLPNDLVLIPQSGEIVRVTAVAGSVLTVVRAEGGTAAVVTNGCVLIKIGSAWGEGSSLRDASNGIISLETVKGNEYNYTQVDKTALSLSNTEIAMGQNGGMFSGDPLKYQAVLKGMEHAKKMEYTAFYGKRGKTGTFGKTGGFIEFITTTSATTSLTDANINADAESFFRYGKDTKGLFCGKLVSRRISQTTANGVQRITPGESKYGVRIRHYLADTGEFDIVPVDTLNDYAAYKGYGLFIDPTDVKYRFMAGRDTQLLVNAQLPDIDGKVSAYLTEWGLQRGHASHHGMWTSVA